MALDKKEYQRRKKQDRLRVAERELRLAEKEFARLRKRPFLVGARSQCSAKTVKLRRRVRRLRKELEDDP